MIKLGFYVAALGLFEFLLLGESFWLLIDVKNIFVIKNFDNWIASELPGNYYSYDFYNLLEQKLLRLVGITTDPLLTSHLLAFSYCLLLFYQIRMSRFVKRLDIIIISIAIIFTLSKGAILICAISTLCYIWNRNKILSITLMSICIALLYIIVTFNTFRTISIHLDGLYTAIPKVSLFGDGIGTAGNFAGVYTNQSTNSGENFLGMLICQIGVIGSSLYFYIILRQCFLGVNTEKSSNSFKLGVFIFVFSVMLEATLSESALNFIGSGLAFIALGFFTKSNKKDIYENRNFNFSPSI